MTSNDRPRKSSALHVLARLWRVNVALWGYLAWWGCVRVGLFRTKVAPAVRFAATLERLGTTFVKLGQGLGVHGELLPDDYTAALQKLQDHVGPFPSAVALAEVEKSLGRPVAEMFAWFDMQAMAAGSIAQVHRARLPDGREVIVKIRRPGILREVTEDIRIFRWFVTSIQPVLPALRRQSPMTLIDELSRNLHKELDFRQEAANIVRFCEMFRGWRTVYIPGVASELSTDCVIVQEFSCGRRVDDPAFLADGPRLAQNLVDAYIHQLFGAGVFHADPHPGNIFVLPDGRLCLHDFGLVGFVDKSTRKNLVAMMQAFVRQDPDWLLDAYLDLGILEGKLDRGAFRVGLDQLIQDYARLPLHDWSFGEAFLSIARIGKSQNIRIPHRLLVLLRTMFLMESTVRHLDPAFNLMEGLFVKAGDAFKALLRQENLNDLFARLEYETLISLEELPRGLSHLMRSMRSEAGDVSPRQPALHELRQEIRSAGSTVALALITLGLYVAASLLMLHSIGPRVAGIPVLAALGYALALWFTWKVARRAAAQA